MQIVWELSPGKREQARFSRIIPQTLKLGENLSRIRQSTKLKVQTLDIKLMKALNKFVDFFIKKLNKALVKFAKLTDLK